MDRTTLALLVALVAVSMLLVAFFVLWLVGHRTQRKLRAELEEARSPRSARRTPRRLVPTPDEAVKAVWETVDRVREKGFGGAIRSSIDDLAGWAQVERPARVLGDE